MNYVNTTKTRFLRDMRDNKASLRNAEKYCKSVFNELLPIPLLLLFYWYYYYYFESLSANLKIISLG